MKKISMIIAMLFAVSFTMTSSFAQTKKVPSKKGTVGIVAPTKKQGQQTPTKSKSATKKTVKKTNSNGQTNEELSPNDRTGGQTVSSVSGSGWGPWIRHQGYRGIQLRSRLADGQDNAKIEGVYSWDIEIKNNYADKIVGVGVLTTLDVKDPKRSIGGPASPIGAGKTSFPFTMNSTSNQSIKVFLDVYFEKDKDIKNDDGTVGKMAAFDNGSPSENCLHDPFPPCPNYQKPKSDVETSRETKPDNSTDGKANQTADLSAQKDELSADELKRKIFENLKTNLRAATYSYTTSHLGTNAYSNISLSQTGDSIMIEFTVTIKNIANTRTIETSINSRFIDLSIDLFVTDTVNPSNRLLHIDNANLNCKDIVNDTEAGGYKNSRGTCGYASINYDAGNNDENYNQLVKLLKQLKSLNGK